MSTLTAPLVDSESAFEWDFQPLIGSIEAYANTTPEKSPVVPMGDITLDILQLVVPYFEHPLDLATLFPELRQNQSRAARADIAALSALCRVNRAWHAVAKPVLWKHVCPLDRFTDDSTHLAVFRSLPVNGHLVKSLDLKISLDDDTDVDAVQLSAALRSLTSLEWLSLDLSIRRRDAETMVVSAKEALTGLHSLRWLRLHERYLVASDMVGPATQQSLYSGKKVYEPLIYGKAGARPSIMPDAFEGHVCYHRQDAPQLPVGLSGITVYRLAKPRLALAQLVQSPFESLRVLHLDGKCEFVTDGTKLSLPSLEQLWLNLENWSWDGRETLYFDLSPCQSLKSLAMPRLSPNPDAHLPASLRQLHLLRWEPEWLVNAASLCSSLDLLVVHTEPHDHAIYVPSWENAAQAAALLVREASRNLGLAFWPAELENCAIAIEHRDLMGRYQLPASGRVRHEEQVAAFLQSRLPRSAASASTPV